jgi:hypothetical protein
MSLSNYNKFLVAVAGLVMTYLTMHYGARPWVTDVTMILTALGIYQTPNSPQNPK